MRVYDLTIDKEHCFFAEGILTHNCMDALQYLCSRITHVDRKKKNEYLAQIRARLGAVNKKKAAGGYR